MERERRIAVLIDGDNAQASLVREILSEVSKHGKITTRRIYGDFTTSYMNSWNAVLSKNAITPHQQFAYSTGKNSTDSFMIIDAMDLLHSGKFGGFAIVSSDSDFTRLATRIREEGLFVMGVGRRNTLAAFVNACELFVYTDIIVDEELDIAPDVKGSHPSVVDETGNISDYSELTVAQLKDVLRERELPVSGTKPELIARLETPILEDAESMIAKAIDLCTLDEEGWGNLANVGEFLLELNPAFDSRSYGHKKLSLLIQSIPAFEYRMDGIGKYQTRIVPDNN